MGLKVRTLLGASGLDFSAMCLGSLVRNSAEPLTICVHSDGSIGERQKDVLRRRVGADMEFVSIEETNDRVEAAIGRYRHLQSFRASDLFAKKILDIAVMEESERIRYCDSDIIFFRRFSGLFTSAGPGQAMFMKDAQSAYAFSWNVGARRFFPLPDSLNAGLIDFPKASFDFDLLEHGLSTGVLTGWRGWREQTMWAWLATRTQNIWPEGLVIPEPGDTIGKARAWHLVSVIRHCWDPRRLADVAERHVAEVVEPFAMKPFSTTTYPNYISQRSKRSLARRVRLAFSRVRPQAAS